MDIIQLIGSPRRGQARRRVNVAIALHAGKAQRNDPSLLHIRQKLCVQIFHVAAKVVIRVNAYYRVEELFRKGQTFRRIGFNRNNLPIGQSKTFEKTHVVGRAAPEVGGISHASEFSSQQCRGNSSATTQIQHYGT